MKIFIIILIVAVIGVAVFMFIGHKPAEETTEHEDMNDAVKESGGMDSHTALSGGKSILAGMFGGSESGGIADLGDVGSGKAKHGHASKASHTKHHIKTVHVKHVKAPRHKKESAEKKGIIHSIFGGKKKSHKH